MYVGPFPSVQSKKWFSPGRHAKTKQVIDTLIDLGYDCKVLNTCPCIDDQKNYLTLNLCTSRNRIIRYLQLVTNSINCFSADKYRNRANLIWLYNTKLPELLVALNALVACPKAKVILQLEDLPKARKENGGIEGFIDYFSTRILAKIAFKVFAVSQAVGNAFASEYGYKKRFFILPPSLDSNYLEIISKREPPLTNQHSRIILYAGGYSYDKGVDILLNAFKDLNPLKYNLYLVGPAPNLLISQFSIYDNIKFFGVIGKQQLYRLYSEADIVVNPHRPILNSNYIFPFKTIEQLASGCLPFFTRSIYTENFSFPDDCYFDVASELMMKIEDSSSLLAKNKDQLEQLSQNVRDYYSIINSKLIIKQALETV